MWAQFLWPSLLNCPFFHDPSLFRGWKLWLCPHFPPLLPPPPPPANFWQVPKSTTNLFRDLSLCFYVDCLQLFLSESCSHGYLPQNTNAQPRTKFITELSNSQPSSAMCASEVLLLRTLILLSFELYTFMALHHYVIESFTFELYTSLA